MSKNIISETTITELAELITSKEVSSEELQRECGKVIAEKNPDLNAFVNVMTTEVEADSSDRNESKKSGLEKESKLAGIPTAFKDNFNIKGTLTTASAKMLANYEAPYTATVAERLLSAGAVSLGKTNLDAFAHGSSTETSDFGVTKNPHDLKRVAGGSSGGSAAAVAAEMVPYAIGSETAGSVRGPAAWCGVYGFTPTYGRNSRYGLISMGSSLDRPGVFANSVRDCAIVSEVMAGHDPQDATTIPEAAPKFSSELEAKVKDLKIGLPKIYFDERINSEVRARAEAVAKLYENLGAEIVEVELLDPKYSVAVYTIICRSEVSSNLARLDGIRYGYRSQAPAASILEQVAKNRGEAFGNEAKQRSLTGAYALSAGYYDAYYKKALQVRELIISDFERVFTEVDILLAPTMPDVAPKIGVTANNPLFGELADLLTEASALAGLPAISLPAGNSKTGLPIGVQLIGPFAKEQLVLDTALTFEDQIANEL